MFDFSEFSEIVGGSVFDEKPVELEEFVTSKDFLGFPPLSENQLQAIRNSTQIFDKETLFDELYPNDPEKAQKRWEETHNEIVLAWGKGSTSPDTEIYDGKTGLWRRLDSYEGGLVASAYKEDGNVKFCEGTASFYEGTGKMFRVTTARGRQIDVWEGHRFLSKDLTWHRLWDLKVGDKVAISTTVPEPIETVEMKDEHVELLALLIANGSTTTKSVNITFGEDAEKSIHRTVELFESFPNTSAQVKVDKYEGTTRVHIIAKDSGTKNYSKELYQFIVDYGLFGKTSREKEIPSEIFRLPTRQLRLFVSRLIDSDGWFCKTNTAEIGYSTISETLAEQVCRLWLRLGVLASKTLRNVRHQGGTSTAWQVRVRSNKEVSNLGKQLSLLDKQKLADEILDWLKDKKSNVAMHGDLFWDRIESIEYLGIDDYWTLTVEETEAYVSSGGVYNHNSGKDSSSTVACAYIVYQLLCLRNPQEYFGKPNGDYIDIMNIATNAQQANQVFFKGLRARIKGCPWFEGKWTERGGEIEFDKFVRIISGHSESESLEGYNVIVVVLDEIDGFVTAGTASTSKKTAESIYKMHRASVESRFGSRGKIVSLSFPRTKEGFLMKHYEGLIAEKVVEQMEHTFKLDPDLPDGTEGNELVVQWTHDHVTRYVRPGIYVQRRPTWEVNPTKHIDDFALSFFQDVNDSLGRFAAEPVDAVEGFFKDHDKIEHAFRTRNGVSNDTGKFEDWFKPQPDKRYYVHVDLAQKHDRAAVAMAHVEKFVRQRIAGKIYSAQPYVIVDAVRWWTPKPNRDIDFKDVTDYVVSLHQRGFDIRLVTLDRWRSEDVIKYFNSIGLKSERLSVLKPQYQDLSMVLHEERLEAPAEELTVKEMKQLVLLPNDKIDHPRSGGKDTSDAIAGAVYNAVRYTPNNQTGEIEIVTMSSFGNHSQPETEEPHNLIKAPPGTKMPADIEDWLQGMGAL